MMKNWFWWISLGIHIVAIGYILIHAKKDHESVSGHREHVHIDIEPAEFSKQVSKKVVKLKKKLETELEEAKEPEVLKAVESNFKKETITYAAYLRSILNLKKTYPLRAKRLGHEGTVLASIELNKNGEVVKLDLKKSSKSKILDKAAFSLIQKNAPFREPPEFLKDLIFDVYLEWHL